MRKNVEEHDISFNFFSVQRLRPPPPSHNVDHQRLLSLENGRKVGEVMLDSFYIWECSDGDAARKNIEEHNVSFNFSAGGVSVRPLLHSKQFN